MELNFSDFEKQNVKFDIIELQKAYKEILKIKDFSGSRRSFKLWGYFLNSNTR